MTYALKTEALASALSRMLTIAGITGCALVEIEAGMVWRSTGDIPDVQTIAEAASDYWRLYLRLEHQFDRLGGLRGSLMWHAQGQLVLLPCGKGVLLVGLAMQGGPVDWAACFDQAQQLAVLVEQL